MVAVRLLQDQWDTFWLCGFPLVKLALFNGFVCNWQLTALKSQFLFHTG